MRARSTFWYDKNELEALFSRVRASGVQVPRSEVAPSRVEAPADPAADPDPELKLESTPILENESLFTREACSRAVAGLARETAVASQSGDWGEPMTDGEEVNFYTAAATASRASEPESAEDAEAMSLFGRQACSVAVAGLVRDTAATSRSGDAGKPSGRDTSGGEMTVSEDDGGDD
jgi:hypothetical protein